MPSKIVEYYIKEKTEEAAVLLEKLSADELAGTVEDLDSALAARLFAYLLPHVAVACLRAISPQRGAAIVDALPHAASARLLAGLAHQRRREMLDCLSEEKRQRLQHALLYPEDSVGAVMHADVPCCRDTASVREVKQMVRRFQSLPTPVLSVLDNMSRPIGTIAIGDLLRLKEKEMVAKHMHGVSGLLRVRAPLASVATLRTWITEDYLPVVEVDERLAGLLSKGAVYQYLLARDQSPQSDHDLTAGLLALAELMWRPGAALLSGARDSTRGEQS